MKVELNAEQGFCLVTKESGDPYFKGVRNAAGESRLLYHVKRVLNRQGFNFIKKQMAKDGHLVDEMQQYLREAKTVNGRRLAIYNDQWAIKGADAAFNRNGLVELRCVNLEL